MHVLGSPSVCTRQPQCVHKATPVWPSQPPTRFLLTDCPASHSTATRSVPFPQLPWPKLYGLPTAGNRAQQLAWKQTKKLVKIMPRGKSSARKPTNPPL